MKDIADDVGKGVQTVGNVVQNAVQTLNNGFNMTNDFAKILDTSAKNSFKLDTGLSPLLEGAKASLQGQAGPYYEGLLGSLGKVGGMSGNIGAFASDALSGLEGLEAAAPILGMAALA